MSLQLRQSDIPELPQTERLYGLRQSITVRLQLDELSRDKLLQYGATNYYDIGYDHTARQTYLNPNEPFRPLGGGALNRKRGQFPESSFPPKNRVKHFEMGA